MTLNLKSEWEFARKSRRRGIETVEAVLSKGTEALRGEGRTEGVAPVTG